ncbi:DNA-binding protein [Sphingomonas sp.]|uniref:DNA-binding protein n=1 Tax=Sphingomonas sp. TaxID=28214 RepID=UPI000DB3546B|nr:DNA-binding protein [Sphingomonas sp.]PZU06337.1 MAG: DNA-binding protein [Sphingomonas sp.]
MGDGPDRRYLTSDQLHGAIHLNDVKPLRLVTPTIAAKYLTITRHSLACYRNLGGGPAYYKFGRWIRYSLDDLDEWVTLQRRLGGSMPRKVRFARKAAMIKQYPAAIDAHYDDAVRKDL